MMKLGLTYPERKKIINDHLESKHSEYETQFEFKGATTLHKVYKVPIDMPKYRLANGRTFAEQQEFLISNKDKGDDFFYRDVELSEAHIQQHEILKKMLVDKGTDLISYFKDKDQSEPLIIDNNGFVVNGNRRLCAIRELYYSDKTKYKRFSNVYTIILPPCTEKEIDELEARLQIIKDIKANYSWVSESCMLREKQKKNGYSDDELAKLYDMKPSDIREKIDILALCEEYLESRNLPKKYSKVLGDEYAFMKIREGRIRNSDRKAEEKDIFKNISYLVIDNPEEAKMGRAYEAIPNIAKNLDLIIDELVNELPIDNYNYENNNPSIDLLGEINDEDDRIGRLVLAVEDERNKDDILETVKNIIEREKCFERDNKKASFVLSQLKKAQSCLRDALNAFSNDTLTKGINEQLDSIDQIVSEIRKKVHK